MVKLKLLSQNYNFQKCIHFCELDNFPIIKAISDGIDGDNNKYTFFII